MKLYNAMGVVIVIALLLIAGAGCAIVAGPIV